MHPKYTFNWGDLDCQEILDLRDQLVRNSSEVIKNRFSKIYKEIFVKLGLYFEIKDNVIVLDLGSQPLISLLGIDVNEKSLVAKKVDSKYEDSLELISQLSEF